MKRRIFALLLAMLLCSGLLAGCGEKTETAAPAPAVDTPATTGSASAPAEETSPALTAEQTEYWIGDWYGVIMIEDSGGSPAETNWPGDWADIAGRSTLNEDGSITLKLWGDELWNYDNPMVELTASVAAPGAGKPLGIATAVAGKNNLYVWPEPGWEISAGSWVLDPASTDYDRLICLKSVYRGATEADFVSFSLLLRPWGMLWDDVCAGPNINIDTNGTLNTRYARPMQYTQYYLPMLENGYPISNSLLDVNTGLRSPVDGVYASKTFDYHGYSVTYPLGYFTTEGVNLEDLVNVYWAFQSSSPTKVYFRDIGTAENLAEHYATKADYATRSDVSGYETWDSTVDGYTVHNYVYELQGWGWYYEAYIDYGGDIGTASVHQSSYAAYIYFTSDSRDNVYNSVTEAMVNSFVFHG